MCGATFQAGPDIAWSSITKSNAIHAHIHKRAPGIRLQNAVIAWALKSAATLDRYPLYGPRELRSSAFTNVLPTAPTAPIGYDSDAFSAILEKQRMNSPVEPVK